MGYMWAKIVCEAVEKPVSGLAKTSQFAEVMASFSTVNQEKRHEALPSWYPLA